MDDLAPLCEAVPKHLRPKGAKFCARVRDRRTSQEVVFTSNEEISAFDLERAIWASGCKHCDAVIIALVDASPLVCFVEIKGSWDQKAIAQIHGAATHFHPAGRSGKTRTHGDDHHDRWSDGGDPIDPMPATTHPVVGLAIGFHHVPRPPPSQDVTLGAKRLRVRAIQISRQHHNLAILDFKDLLRRNGLT